MDEAYAHMGIGPKLMDLLIDRAKKADFSKIFVLTTKTADWFERFGFKSTNISEMPPKRREKWTEKRGSKILIRSL